MQKNNFIQESAQRTEQLRRQKLMKERRDKGKKSSRDTRRYIEIGKMVCKHFPSLLDCLSETNEGKPSELDFLDFVLKLHHSHPDLICRLRNLFERQNL